MVLDPNIFERLAAAAKAAALNAYCPYSNFRVGAAILSNSSKIYSACNVENASYGLTCCAERNAVFAMVAAGETKISQVVIYTPTSTPTAPCGACRQVLREFTAQAQLVSICDGEEVLSMSLDELLPNSFGPQDLK